MDGRAAAVSAGGPLLAAEVIDVEADVGRLWMLRSDALVAPAIRAAEGVWEPDLSAFLRRRLRPGDTFVDVGAHVGYFSLLAGSLVGPTGRVIAVEPEPLTRTLLQANLWRHRMEAATVVAAAALDRRDHVRVGRSPEGIGQVLADGQGGALLVPALPLDELLEGVEVDVVKLDCDFSDHLAVRGLRRTIESNPGITIVVEFVAVATDHRPGNLSGASGAEVLTEYRELPLRLRVLDPGGEAISSTDRQLLDQPPGGLQTLVLDNREG